MLTLIDRDMPDRKTNFLPRYSLSLNEIGARFYLRFHPVSRLNSFLAH